MYLKIKYFRFISFGVLKTFNQHSSETYMGMKIIQQQLRSQYSLLTFANMPVQPRF